MASKMSDFLILNELLESDESSDDEEEIALLLEEKRNIPKVMKFVETVVHKFSDKEFKSNFRVERTTCYKLIEEFRNSQFFPRNQNHGGSNSITAEIHVLCFLWFAGNKVCLRDVSQRFGIGTTSGFRIICRVVDFLISIAGDIICFPSSRDDKNSLANEFKKVSGFPDVLGCIDSTSIPIRTPANKIKSTYVNRHDIPSIILQGICDYRRRLIDVFVGAPGKVHDARVFKLSFISSKLPQICEGKFHLLGDGAYPIREWLLIPYKDYGNLTPDKTLFNQKLSSTRVLIENTFGILKSRLRQLQKLDLHKVDKISKFIIASCVIHNLCIDNNDVITDEWLLPQPPHEDNVINDMGRESLLKQLGENKRDAIKNGFFNETNNE
ncbi:unnamed protein product [Callosobruchus maculatus]|uniref:DDE Tnp4 domain-containing protein n=1 Tax=Callosobruchus maculatus TaxID=64391 RepID=A0A653DQG0_CALMS|nr:unnamed protein product [Callosobruchus maculatus]VEN62038.1 unnamed protein product [Callosobruchus maculatus]